MPENSKLGSKKTKGVSDAPDLTAVAASEAAIVARKVHFCWRWAWQSNTYPLLCLSALLWVWVVRENLKNFRFDVLKAATISPAQDAHLPFQRKLCQSGIYWEYVGNPHQKDAHTTRLLYSQKKTPFAGR
jgi:hypothetical protein